MVAGDKQKHLDKLFDLQCDTAMVNLEDGVYDKQYALDLLVKNFSKRLMRLDNKEVIVRVNDLNFGGVDDIKIINKLKPNAIRIPKIKDISDVELALKLIDNDIDIHLSIETKEGFKNISKFKIDDRVKTVYLGILDLLESLELPQNIITINNPMIEYILSKFLIDSKLVNLNPVSFTYQNYKNINMFELWCLKCKNMGYSAMSCISPQQVDIVNKVFANGAEEIKKARYIKKVFEIKKQQGVTGFADKSYGFIDEPIYKDALLLLKNNS